jgi:hypothetical protein
VAPARSSPGRLGFGLAALVLAGAVAACGNQAADTAASGTPTSSPTVEAPEVAPTEVEPTDTEPTEVEPTDDAETDVEPSETEPTRIEPTKPRGTPIPEPKPADVAAAKKLVVIGKDVGSGWETTEDYDDLDLQGDGIEVKYPGRNDDRYCDNQVLTDELMLFTASAEATDQAAAGGGRSFIHQVAHYGPGGAEQAAAELGEIFADCQEQRDVFWDGPEEIVVSAKSAGAGRADITISVDTTHQRGALAYEVRGDYVSTVIAFAPTTAAARALVDKVAALAAAKFAAKVNR